MREPCGQCRKVTRYSHFQRTCDQCGTDYCAQRPEAKYCTSHCRYLAGAIKAGTAPKAYLLARIAELERLVAEQH